MKPLVRGPERALEPYGTQNADVPRERPARTARKEDEDGQDRCDEDRGLDPEVRADVVAPDREQEADGREQQRCEATERPFEEDRSRDRGRRSAVATRRCEDA